MVDLPNQAAALDVEESRTDNAVAAPVRAALGFSSGGIRNAALAAAILVAFGTSAWAIWSGDSLPVTAMLLYCMLASTLALYAATAAERTRSSTATKASTSSCENSICGPIGAMSVNGDS